MGIDLAKEGWWAGRVGGSAGFFGRERELSRLQAAVAGAVRVVLVVGDAGVGKTRFVVEGLLRAQKASVSGACAPFAEQLPLLPAAEALRELARLDGGGLLDNALQVVPPYVRAEAARLLPQLGTGEPGAGGLGESRRERLFSAVAELLGAAGRLRRLAVVVEDVHWADGATLDLLTFLARSAISSAVMVVVTCRSDEAPLDPQAREWLAHIRGEAGVEEIRLGSLSREEVGAHVEDLAGGPVPREFVDDVYARAEGNPFFTEQLVAAAIADAPGGRLSKPAGLSARLADLLAARASRCRGDARVVLDALAVAGRPLPETMLCSVTGLEIEAVRRGLRELAAARLLADTAPENTYRPRHALLTEAIVAVLLPGDCVLLHQRIAHTLDDAGAALAGEAAAHWAAAGQPADELPARLAAAAAAERVLGYAEAAAHWLRAIELCEMVPEAVKAHDVNVPRLHVRAMEALNISGDRESAGQLAEAAYRRFAEDPDPATAALVHLRAAMFREFRAPAAAKPVMERALQLFGNCPPTPDKAEAWWRYAAFFLFHAEGRLEASQIALTRALEIAGTANAPALTVRILSWLAVTTFLRGRVDDGFSLLDRGSALADASGDDLARLWLASTLSDVLVTLGEYQRAAELGRRGLDAAREAGIDSCLPAMFLAGYAADALLAVGRTAEAAALIDPLTAGPATREHWDVHECRVQIDLLRGDVEAATARQRQISSFSFAGSIDNSRRLAQCAAELALWAGRPGEALTDVQRVLALYQVPDLTNLSGSLLATGMRACADLAEQARARREHGATQAALDAAAELVSWAGKMSSAPFADHPFLADIPAERATWDAERTRLTGQSDPSAWDRAANAWQDLGCPHRAGYAWWRRAQAQLDAGQPAAMAAAALHAAAAAADEHAPLRAQVRLLAERARIPLHSVGTAATAPAASSAGRPVIYGLTGRELAVLRLLATGRSNAQIGAELYISPSTAGVHVSSILRKLGVHSRVQAAALAERAGLLRDSQS